MNRRELFTLAAGLGGAVALPAAAPAPVITPARVKGTIQRVEIVITTNEHPSRVAERIVRELQKTRAW